jgi:hypothetical protein
MQATGPALHRLQGVRLHLRLRLEDRGGMSLPPQVVGDARVHLVVVLVADLVDDDVSRPLVAAITFAAAW